MQHTMGLWSLDICFAGPAPYMTPRESPAFPTTMCVGVMMAQMAVHPEVSCRCTNSSSVLSTASSSRYACLMAASRCDTSRFLVPCMVGYGDDGGLVRAASVAGSKDRRHELGLAHARFCVCHVRFVILEGRRPLQEVNHVPPAVDGRKLAPVPVVHRDEGVALQLGVCFFFVT